MSVSYRQIIAASYVYVMRVALAVLIMEAAYCIAFYIALQINSSSYNNLHTYFRPRAFRNFREDTEPLLWPSGYIFSPD